MLFVNNVCVKGTQSLNHRLSDHPKPNLGRYSDVGLQPTPMPVDFRSGPEVLPE